MAFRIVAIEHPAEVHVRSGQLVVIQDAGTTSIPVRDIAVLVAGGPNIRISTLAQAMLADADVAVLMLSRNHMPSAITLPLVGASRQAKTIQAQAHLPSYVADELWRRIIIRKIENQAQLLRILGLEGADEVEDCASCVLPGDKSNREGSAAKLYFTRIQPGLKRREPNPLNSALYYGYAIVRSLMAREIVCAGLEPALGLHHRSQLNAFNLVDDLMEPLRPVVDMLALEVVTTKIRLSPRQRARLREALRMAVGIDGGESSVLHATRIMASSLRSSIMPGNPEKLTIPSLVPFKLVDTVGE